MKKLMAVCVICYLTTLVPIGRAQEKPVSSEKAKASVPIKIQLMLTEYDGEKKVASLPYSILLGADPSGGHVAYSSFTRIGVRVPIPGAGKEGQTNFADVGSNIDCGVQAEEEGRFSVRLNFERSSLYFQGRGEEKGTIRTVEGGQPYIPTLRAQSLVSVREGQNVEVLTATDPLNGHVFRINLTLNVQK
jgi:hypothetical protein